MADEEPGVLDQIKAAMLARLRDRLPDLEVDVFPDDPSKYRLRHRKGAALVAFEGSRYGRSEDLGDLVQDREIRWQISVIARSLRDDGDAVRLVERVGRALQGWRAPHCRPTQLLSEQFVGQAEGEWTYAVRVATPTTAVANPDPTLTE